MSEKRKEFTAFLESCAARCKEQAELCVGGGMFGNGEYFDAPGAAGKLKLYNTEPKTAAMVMAIVADKLQKPMNELRFISIKEVSE